MMTGAQQISIPLNMVGGTNFGRYSKISDEQTFNMIVSKTGDQQWLVPYAGYANVKTIDDLGTGRGIFTSVRFGHMVIVINNKVYICDNALNIAEIGTLHTNEGTVYIDENDGQQIAICDQQYLYIYNYSTNTFTTVTLDFTPAYIAFQDGYFIAPVKGQPRWRLSAANDGTSWPASPENVGTFQTKPDNAKACIRFPGRGNLLFVMGGTVTEPWIDTGTGTFPYQRSSSYNIDYGCLNADTIAVSDTFIVWLGVNEKSGPAIMMSEGGTVKQISNEGLNFKFSQLNDPTKCSAFLFKQDGHLLYQFTFYDPEDNISYVYDFNTGYFFSLTDPDMNMHIAKRVAFFNNTYYFVSFIDGDLYELNSSYDTADGKSMQCIRIPPPIRFPDNKRYVMTNINFIIEQGDVHATQRVDLSMSLDGGISFGNQVSKTLNAFARRPNKFDFYQLGSANDCTFQYRFEGKGRFVVGEGTLSVFK